MEIVIRILSFESAFRIYIVSWSISTAFLIFILFMAFIISSLFGGLLVPYLALAFLWRIDIYHLCICSSFVHNIFSIFLMIVPNALYLLLNLFMFWYSSFISFLSSGNWAVVAISSTYFDLSFLIAFSISLLVFW